MLTALIIQIPAIQTKIVHYASSFISTKTHTKVEIKNISLTFPRSVVIEGLYLEDRQKDTLLYAGRTKINIALYDLFHNKIAIRSSEIEDASLNLYSTKADSLFNYNFLITAFGDTTKQSKATPQTPSKWTFGIDQVSLKSVRFRYDDQYGGMNVSAALQNSEFSVDEIDPGKSIYSVNDLLVEGLTANVLVRKSENVKKAQQGSVLPKIAAKKLQLSNSTVSYIDSVGYLSVSSVIDQSTLKNASVDLQKQLLMAESIYLSKSKIQYHTFAQELTSK